MNESMHWKPPFTWGFLPPHLQETEPSQSPRGKMHLPGRRSESPPWCPQRGPDRRWLSLLEQSKGPWGRLGDFSSLWPQLIPGNLERALILSHFFRGHPKPMSQGSWDRMKYQWRLPLLAFATSRHLDGLRGEFTCPLKTLFARVDACIWVVFISNG